MLLRGAAYIKEHYHKPVRINTNGLGSLINGEDIAPKLAGLVDTVSISLNTPDAEEYISSCAANLAISHFLQCYSLQKNVPNTFRML